MKPPRYSHPEREVIENAAADWLVAHDRGLTPVEKVEFGRWLNENPSHASAWQEARMAWSRLDRMVELPTEAVERSAAWEVVAKSEPATAALVALPASFPETQVPETRAAAKWKSALPWVAAALAIGPAAFWWQSRNDLIELLPAPDAAAQVVTIMPRQLVLPDGSRVELNANSEIAEEFTAAERHVRLVRGEAHFTVTKDRTRPFVVDASGVTVRAVGTAFNVKLDATAVEVLVTEGTVRLEEGRAGAVIPRATEEIAADSSFLDAGRRAIIPLVSADPAEAGARIADLTSDDIRTALAWQAVRLKFADMPLDRVAAEFNRFNPGHLIVDESARDVLVAGTFHANNAAVFVDFLESAFGVAADRRADGTILLRKAH